jgi:hypothetical protein
VDPPRQRDSAEGMGLELPLKPCCIVRERPSGPI